MGMKNRAGIVPAIRFNILILNQLNFFLAMNRGIL